MARLVFGALLWLSAGGIAHADSTANTDDKSVSVPTGWWTYTNVTGATVSSLLATNQARLTDIEVYNASTPTFTVTMVKNSGAYATGWWWYYNQTAADVSSKLSANGGRLVDITPYSTASGIRFAIIMVPNSGATARNWGWLVGVSSAQIGTYLSNSNSTANPQRLIDLKSYIEGGVKKYVVVSVSNTGSDAKSWQYWFNQSVAGIGARVSAFGGRVVKLNRQSDGTYNFIQVKNTGYGWWHYYSFTSASALVNYAAQLANRPVDIVTYTVGGLRRYDAAFIDNANFSTRRVRGVFAQQFLDASGNPTRGIFEAYLKQVGGSVKVDLNAYRSAEVASSLKSLHLLHAMKQVQAGTSLASAFNYYVYPSDTAWDDGYGNYKGLTPNACPNPADEVLANKRTNYNFEKGLDEMMRISDNRTTRGVVLRYGFDAINDTANDAGLIGTELRHNIGCAYYNQATGNFDPNNLRNLTTARDLATIFEGVWSSTLLSSTNNARSEYLESANPSVGASDRIQAIINDEASKQGKLSIADDFGALVRNYGKGGSYGTCLPDGSGDCGQAVAIRSSTGIIRLPVKTSSGLTTYRTYVFGTLMSDVPVSCFDCSEETAYIEGYRDGHYETFRDEIKSALLTW